MSDEQIRAELFHRVLYGIPSVAKPQGVMTVDANGEVVKPPHMPFAPAGASPLSEKGYVNKSYGFTLHAGEEFIAKDGDIDKIRAVNELPVTLSQSEDGNTWQPVNEEEASKIVATAHLLPRKDNA